VACVIPDGPGGNPIVNVPEGISTNFAPSVELVKTLPAQEERINIIMIPNMNRKTFIVFSLNKKTRSILNKTKIFIHTVYTD
jgi:hypothetical protein